MSYMGFRTILIFWIIANAIITMTKKRSLNEVFSMQTFYGLYTSLSITIQQFISLTSTAILLSQPFLLSDIFEPEVKDQFW